MDFNSLLRRHLQFWGPAESNKAEKKGKRFFCGLNRWALISQTGTTVTVQLWKPPHLGPKKPKPLRTPGPPEQRFPNLPARRSSAVHNVIPKDLSNIVLGTSPGTLSNGGLRIFCRVRRKSVQAAQSISQSSEIPDYIAASRKPGTNEGKSCQIPSALQV